MLFPKMKFRIDEISLPMTLTMTLDFQKTLHALTEMQSIDVNHILENFFNSAIPSELSTDSLRLNHIGFEACLSLEIILTNLPHWLEKLSSAFGKEVILKKSLRFNASPAFQRRVNAKAEILCLWFQIDGELLMLELFDVAHSTTHLLQNTTQDSLFANDAIWHYSIGVGEQKQVENLHRKLQVFCQQNPSYKLVYDVPIENQYDGSFHIKLINLEKKLEIEFSKNTA